MKPNLLSGLCLAFALGGAAMAADPAESPGATDAKKKEEPATPPASPAKEKSTAPAAVAATDQAAASNTGTPQPPKDPTMLPQVEVNKSRITNLDIEISEKQRAIDREKLKTKPTKLDTALNDSKLSKALSIFGGSSAENRSDLAKERVGILEEEKEILEAMKTAQTRAEKDELQQELDILRATRRELEQAPK